MLVLMLIWLLETGLMRGGIELMVVLMAGEMVVRGAVHVHAVHTVPVTITFVGEAAEVRRAVAEPARTLFELRSSRPTERLRFAFRRRGALGSTTAVCGMPVR